MNNRQLAALIAGLIYAVSDEISPEDAYSNSLLILEEAGLPFDDPQEVES